jgi:enoyl-CoA hydratase/carnithine racemase
MSYETILVAVTDEVATITLNRPDRANTISPQLVDDVTGALRSIEADAAVRAVIITGAGRHFCGGADLKELRSGMGRGLDLDFFNVFEQHPKPMIAAINGAAMGGGCEIALACDIRVIAEDAMIGTPEIKFGALPAGGGTQRLARFVGVGRAKEMIMTGEPITAAEAHRIGLVNSVVPSDRLIEEADRFARIFVRHAPYALSTAKRLIQKSLDLDLASGLQLERASITAMASPSERAKEQERAAASQAAYGKIFQR